MTTNFTDRWLKNTLRPGPTKRVIREGKGFAVRISPLHEDGTWTVTFLYLYTWEGKQASMNLGQYGAVTLAEARDKHATAYMLVRKGIHPEAKPEPEPTPVTPVNDLTWDHFANLYLARSEKKHAAAWHKTVRMSLNNDVTPVWTGRAISSIRREEGIELLEAVAERAPGQARNVYRSLRAVFTYARSRKGIEANPMLGLTDDLDELIPVQRTRVLKDREIKLIWEKLTDGPGDQRTRDAIKLILLTIQRPIEVVSMHSNQLEGRRWTQEANETKNEHPHLVFLPDEALKLIGNEKGYIFPSPRLDANGQVRHLNRQALSQHVSEHDYFGLERWTPHDLRRTGRTMLTRLGVVEEVAEAIINHKKKKLVKNYNLYEYAKEKKQAAKLWEKALLKIIAGEELPEDDWNE